MPESTRQTLPSGPTSLCFNKEEFMRPDFNVELFIVECRRRVQLETLRDDLALYLKILQSAMIELINKDYADFVNLSTNLVGMDKAINTLVTPLDQLKSEIQNVRGALDDAIAAVEVKMTHQAKIRQKKVCLQRLMNIVQSVATMEKLLGIPPPTPTGIPTPPPSPGPHQTKAPSVLPKDDEPSGQLIERVATEFNKLQFYVSKSRSLPMVDQIKPRIANITSTLQFSLEGLFLQGLETSNMPILRQCLRTYATIDKMRNAENLFRKHVVAPFMEEIINEPFIRTHPQGLRGMYAIVLDFIPKHCRCLKEVTAGSPSSGLEPVRGYEFIVNAVWPEVVSNIEAKIPVIFAPGNPNVFHERTFARQLGKASAQTTYGEKTTAYIERRTLTNAIFAW
ncbi:hypothetical protein CAPTEDRAFT_184924 [Capitella teleta]|uniref:Conserved oligomeric Golgi complex subunit 2 n=1 Tax=Capitella teleta TaxID=283909 RepID=R7V377_CAPTE|nr:hypothetical protein CAPTEDRAFT_184924 [Capitella teleta]|eukprot:ELU10240.1 hypothetical protein CAPTEDRAFT_184924 [Capitella teleta]